MVTPKRSRGPSAPRMSGLPEELLALVFSFVPCPVLCGSASRVSRLWNRVAFDRTAVGRNVCVCRSYRRHEERWCDAAAYAGHLDCLRYLRDRGHPWDENTWIKAARGGHVAVLRYLRGQGCPQSAHALSGAAAGGHLGAVRFLHECDRYQRRTDGGACVMAAASNHGHASILHYLRASGFAWDDRTTRSAAMYGHIDCLRYADAHGCPWGDDMLHVAIEGGSLDCVRYIAERNPPDGEKSLACYDDACAKAVHIGRVDILRYLHESGSPWNGRECAIAASGGHLDCLIYLRAECGRPWNEGVCRLAAQGGHLDVLRYLHRNGCPWDEDACCEAAAHGHLDVLAYLHENGCPWDERTCRHAAAAGHIDCLRYAAEHGCRWDARTPREAARGGHRECLEYIRRNGHASNKGQRTSVRRYERSPWDQCRPRQSHSVRANGRRKPAKAQRRRHQTDRRRTH